VIGFWFAAGIGLLLTLALVLQPLIGRPRPAAPRRRLTTRIFLDQLAEIDRDEASGLLGAPEAEAARLEVKRRMLAISEDTDEPRAPAGARRRGGMALALALSLLIAALAGMTYLREGSLGSPDRPLAARRTTGDLAPGTQAAASGLSPDMRAQLAGTVGQLERYLAEHPGELQGWLLLGRSYLTLDRKEEAVATLGRARLLAPERTDIASAYAEALIVAGNGRISPEARTLLREVAAGDPDNPQARYYLALDQAQQGDVRAALQGWVDLAALSPADAPWLPLTRRQIAAAANALGIDPASVAPSPDVAERSPPPAAGPSADEVAAAQQMSPAEREQMIRSMVDRLAQRLAVQPDDRDGWLRLARAYDVLGETAKAADARARAEAAAR
jgi:cytochrome c-type biogenesis protein CcmH